MTAAKPRVTICVPVPPEGAGLTEVLEAIGAQDADSYQVALSLDGPDAAAEARCKEAAADARVTYSQRPDPVGPLGNLNHLLFHADTEFACVLPEGGLPDPGYLERLLAAMDAAPAAVLALDASGPEAAATAPGPVPRVLAVLSGVDAGAGLSGLIRTAALAKAGRLFSSAAGDLGARAVFLAQLARAGSLVRVPDANCRAVSPVAAPDLDEAQSLEAWWQHCGDIAEVALATPGTVQEVRLLWLAVLTRLLSADLSRPILGRARLPAGLCEALITGFLGRMDATEALDVPFVLDGESERIRRWTRGFCWTPRDKDVIAEFGPQPVNAAEPFNVQPDGSSAIWVKTEGRMTPGTQVRLAGQVLETTVELNTARAVVPPVLAARPGEFPVVLVDADGYVRSNQVTFWVLRATAFGRSLVRMLRRIRGLPDPAARPALPAPSGAEKPS